jgi:YVTN family beta-propeller protein
VIAALASGSAANGWGTTVTLLDGQTGEVNAQVDVGQSPRNATFHWRLLYVATHTPPPAECRDALQVIDVERGELVASIDLPPESRPMMVARGGHAERVYSPNWGNGTLSEIDTSTAAVCRSVEVGVRPEFVQYWNGRLYVANSGSSDVAIIDEATFTVIGRVEVGAHPVRIVIDQQHNDVYVPNLNDGTVSVIDAGTSRVVATLAVGQEPFRIAPWESRGRSELVVLCRAGQSGPDGMLAFVNGSTRRLSDMVAVPGRVANWVWAAGLPREVAYVTLSDEPALVYFDAVRAAVSGVLRLSHQPEPTGYGPGLVISKCGVVFVATGDLSSGGGSVTLLDRFEVDAS